VIRDDGLAAGFVDWVDILGYLIEVVSEAKHSRVTPASRALTTDDFSMIMERANEFALRTVAGKHVSNKSKRDPWRSVKAADSLQTAVDVLAKYHHVAVEKESKLHNVMSQMDVLRWLHNDPQRMGPAGRKTLQGLHLHRKKVVCVRANDLTIDAFYSLYRANVSGAGVVDEAGKVIGCLSASDLKQVAENYDFTMLLKSVKEFLSDEAPEPVVLHAFDTLADVVAKLVTNHVHRVFIVGPGGYPQGVVSTTDVLQVFATEADAKVDSGDDKKEKSEKKEKKGKKEKSKDEKKGDEKKKDKKKKDKKKDKKKKDKKNKK
jgi:CBS domain-containing protein